MGAENDLLPGATSSFIQVTTHNMSVQHIYGYRSTKPGCKMKWYNFLRNQTGSCRQIANNLRFGKNPSKLVACVDAELVAQVHVQMA